MATKVAIFAGFEAFGDFKHNPSGQALAHIRDFCSDFDCVTVELPVCCGSGWQELEETVNRLPTSSNFALVMAGFAGSRSIIEIERFALNCQDYRIPDNEQHQWEGNEIVEGAPAAIRSAAVTPSLVADLAQKGLSCKVSNHAGTFVCNDLYYRALHTWQKSKRCAGVIFAHVPPPAAYREQSTNISHSKVDPDVYPIYRYAEAMALIARSLLK